VASFVFLILISPIIFVVGVMAGDNPNDTSGPAIFYTIAGLIYLITLLSLFFSWAAYKGNNLKLSKILSSISLVINFGVFSFIFTGGWGIYSWGPLLYEYKGETIVSVGIILLVVLGLNYKKILKKN